MENSKLLLWMITKVRLVSSHELLKLCAYIMFKIEIATVSDCNTGKYLILMFYPLDFTFVCPTEIIGMFWSTVILIYNQLSLIECKTSRMRTVKYWLFLWIPRFCLNNVIDLIWFQYTHLAWINTPRKQGGLGELKLPLVSDITKQISRDYGVLLEDEGISLR